MDMFFGGQLEFPYQYVVEQAEQLATVGDHENDARALMLPPEEAWDPFAGW